MNTFIQTSQVQRRAGAMSKLTGLIFAAVLLPAIPASAASFVIHEPAPISAHAAHATEGNGCDYSKLSLQINTPLVMRSSAGYDVASDAPAVENKWTAGATSEWHAGMNRAVDHLVSPPQNINVYAAQTEDHVSGSLAGTHGQDKTLAGFEIVFH
jgi:hypothetical protein